MKHFLEILVSWGPLGIFILSGLDSAGVPVPAAVDILLLALAAKNPSQAYFIALLTIAGSVAGCMSLFYAARKGGRAYFNGHPSISTGKFQEWFERYGLATVFVTTLVPMIPTPTKAFVLSAGILGVSPRLFFLVVLLGRVLHYFGLAYLGIQLGDGAGAYLKSHGWYLAGFALALCAALFVVLKVSEKMSSSQSVE